MGYYLQHKWSLWTQSQQLLKETSAILFSQKKKKRCPYITSFVNSSQVFTDFRKLKKHVPACLYIHTKAGYENLSLQIRC